MQLKTCLTVWFRETNVPSLQYESVRNLTVHKTMIIDLSCALLLLLLMLLKKSFASKIECIMKSNKQMKDKS